MIRKPAIFVCPVPGCASIGTRATSTCRHHPHRAFKREVYVHARSVSDAPGVKGSPFGDAFADLLNSLGKRGEKR